MTRFITLSAITAALALMACGGGATRLELRSSEQVRISQLLGCDDFDIDELDGSREGAPTRRYHAACTDGSAQGDFICADAGSCEQE